MRIISIAAATTLLLTVAASCIQKRQPSAPVARTEPKVDSIHGVVRIDDYHWLRQRGNPEVIEYLEAENAYTGAVMEDTEELQNKLYRELVGRLKQTDMEVAEKDGDYFYYTRTEEGKQYKIICRKKGSLDGAEEVLLDENPLAEGHDYLDIGAYRVSPDDRLLAYTVDTNGSEKYTIYIKDIETGELLSDRVPNVYYSLEWGNDNKTIFYTVLDEAMRPYRLYRHTLGMDYAGDEMVFHETDQAYEMYLSKTKSKRYLLLELGSNTTSEVHYLDANHPTDDFKVIHPRQHKMEYAVYHHDDRFFINTNDGAPNFKLMVTPVRRPDRRHWTEYIAHSDSVKIDGVEVFADFMGVYVRRGGLKQIRIFDLKTGESHYLDFPEEVYTYRAAKNKDFESSTLRFTYSSPLTPNTVYDYDMGGRTWEILKVKEVLGGYDKSRYEAHRVLASSADGTMVPISVYHKKDLERDGRNPLLLYGYGAYGYSSEPRFSSDKISLLERGFVVAIAHVRGGGEMGRYWYEQGMLLHKRNTFSDFIACAEYLIEQNYTSPDHLVIDGGSAGGLLIGAVVNMRPDLFKVALAGMPFVDIVNTMLDASIPLTVIEYEEWGNPNEKEYFDYMMTYSPYDNVTNQAYPHMLITAGLNDPRVQYWEPAKWTAKLRAAKTDQNMLLLKTEMGAGHFGASGRYDSIKETAFEYAFILKALGLDD
ncbi:MAG: S9 family peptidase [Candidatus Zixiibacteriota bacterium]|nr:MAG: S9 family peptidase [candidate division Zixibacteria bacterium]